MIQYMFKYTVNWMMKNKPSTPFFSLENLNKTHVNLMSGIISATTTAAIMNPWDRALYLAIKNNDSFYTRTNFLSPWHGLTQNITQRIISSGSYFFLQEELKNKITAYLSPATYEKHQGSLHITIGFIAGSITGLISNPSTAIRYHSWGHESDSFARNTKIMWQEGQYRPFFKGIKATILRDGIYGCVYEITRKTLLNCMKQSDLSSFNVQAAAIACNFIAAMASHVISAPINYARIKQYAAPSNYPEASMPSILKNLTHKAQQETKTFGAQCRFFNTHLKLGVGSLRAATGITLGQFIFDKTAQHTTRFLELK